jgi:hypothetical protein
MKPAILTGLLAGLFLLVAAYLFGPEDAVTLFRSLTGLGEAP